MAHIIRECGYEGCARRHLAQGLCEAHYRQVYVVGGEPVAVQTRLACQECRGPVYDNYLCAECYMDWWWAEYRQKALKRIVRSIDKPHGEEGCWIWTGAANWGGYGVTTFDGVVGLAHRYIYEILHGIKLGRFEFLDHKCRVRICVNPNHVEMVSPAENSRRGSAVQAACDHCNPPPARSMAEVVARSEPWRIAASPSIEDVYRTSQEPSDV